MSLIKYNFESKHINFRIFGILFHIPYNSFYLYIVKKILKKRLSRKMETIKNKQKIRVGFLVSEQSKWGYQSIYDELASDSRFEPVILITKLYLEHSQKTTFYKKMTDCIDFFRNKKMNIELAYDEEKHKYIPIKDLNIDILFYQQPWELDISQHPIVASKYAITCYSAYGFDLVEFDAVYLECFHRWLDLYFTPSKSTFDYINKQKTQIENVRIVGAPRLDDYHNTKKRKKQKKTIIYAPHHSFEKGSLRLATFSYNGKQILDFAKKHTEFDWVFKPHPRFKYSVIKNNIMSEKEIDKYYYEWEKIGEIKDSGDYIDLFQNSDALITDCCAFLAEYLPSKHPVLHLVSSYAKFNSTAKEFIDSYYSIHNLEEMNNVFSDVLLNDNDYKKKERLNKISLIFDQKEKTAFKIIKILKKDFL